jgi:CheY-like chemotaxis protein
MGPDKINRPKPIANTADAYLKRVERVVELVKNAKTYYEVLGVRPSATREEILKAHQGVIRVLNPLYHRSTALFSADMQRRIDKALQHVTVACAMLSIHSRRIDYDKSIGVQAGANKRQTQVEGDNAKWQEGNPATLDEGEERSPAADHQQPQLAGPAASQSEDNRRRSARLKLVLPVRVTGHDQTTGEWSEVTETVEVSPIGSKLKLNRRVRHRSVVQLSLPLPSELRNHAKLDPNYKVYALVRNVCTSRDGGRIVGVEFIGEKPPQGFGEEPWATFQMQWTGDERRREPRVEKAETVVIEYLDAAMQPIGRDEAVTENIGSRGMRIRLSKPAPEFDLVKTFSGDEKRESIAAVSDRYVNKDGYERICLRLISSTPAPSVVTEPRVGRGSPNGKKILIADDDAPLRKVLGKILAEAGYEVVLAEDGASAVEKAASERPHLVITDGLMPKMHGFIACKTIKQMESPPKVILLTAVYTKKTYKWEVRQQYGADDFMTKPFVVSELLACIEKHLAASPSAFDAVC